MYFIVNLLIVNIYVKLIYNLDSVIVGIIFGLKDDDVILEEEWVSYMFLVLEGIIVMIKDM